MGRGVALANMTGSMKWTNGAGGEAWDMTCAQPGINEIRAAAKRIRGFVRRTPLLAAAPAREYCELARGLLLKLESLQITGSFKARGAISAVLALPPERLRRGIITASGGNHGLGVAYAGWATGVPATIFLPCSVAADKVAKLAPGCDPPPT